GMRLTLVEFTPPGRRTEQAVAEVFSCRLGGEASAEDELLARRLAAFSALAEAPFTREGKNGPRSMDLRPLLLRWAEAPGGGVTFTLDWTMGYLSPLTFMLAVLGPEAEDARLRARLRLRKTGQIFADGRVFPPDGATV
ncbi:MAG: B12-binding domain-containing radical SAM protein, partial [Desulfovibrio sp.]|nr:B12-binding domain-containing radical SAM protein [Desulfovibrio sp.]